MGKIVDDASSPNGPRPWSRKRKAQGTNAEMGKGKELGLIKVVALPNDDRSSVGEWLVHGI